MKGIKRNTILYYFERCFPYLSSMIIVVILWKYKINYIENEYFYNALDSVLTMTGLIVGFLGAVMPVIMGMKNESKFVIYVFQKDKNKLFLKYIKGTVEIGLINAALTVFMYFNENFAKIIKYYSFYVWTYFVFLFFTSTYRSIKYMLELIFSDDSEIKKGKTIDTDISSTQRNVMKELNKDI